MSAYGEELLRRLEADPRNGYSLADWAEALRHYLPAAHVQRLPPAEPTAIIDSPEKVPVMAARYRRGEHIHHPEDARQSDDADDRLGRQLQHGSSSRQLKRGKPAVQVVAGPPDIMENAEAETCADRFAQRRTAKKAARRRQQAQDLCAKLRALRQRS